MSDAKGPERIWALPPTTGPHDAGTWFDAPRDVTHPPVPTEYIRADLYERLEGDNKFLQRQWEIGVRGDMRELQTKLTATERRVEEALEAAKTTAPGRLWLAQRAKYEQQVVDMRDKVVLERERRAAAEKRVAELERERTRFKDNQRLKSRRKAKRAVNEALEEVAEWVAQAKPGEDEYTSAEEYGYNAARSIIAAAIRAMKEEADDE